MTKQLMTNIDASMYQYITTLSKQKKTSKRKILEEALTIYKQFLEQKELDIAYQDMWNDKEYLDEMVDTTKYLAHL